MLWPCEYHELRVVRNVHVKPLLDHRGERAAAHEVANLTAQLRTLRLELQALLLEREQRPRLRVPLRAAPDHGRTNEYESQQCEGHPGPTARPRGYAARRHARRRALRERGVVASSRSPAVIALRCTFSPSATAPHTQTGWRGGQVHGLLQSRKACFTTRSSPEWYAITTIVPPRVSRSRSAGSARSSDPSSSFTSLRNA